MTHYQDDISWDFNKKRWREICSLCCQWRWKIFRKLIRFSFAPKKDFVSLNFHRDAEQGGRRSQCRGRRTIRTSWRCSLGNLDGAEKFRRRGDGWKNATRWDFLSNQIVLILNFIFLSCSWPSAKRLPHSWKKEAWTGRCSQKVHLEETLKLSENCRFDKNEN